jgi:hypothetical protein
VRLAIVDRDARSAVISECGRYRYELSRRWDDRAPLGWVMLNPSTADADTDDPTIRRCIRFAKDRGYGGIVVHNLYAYRVTDPAELANVDDPIGPRNRDFLASDLPCTVAGWGAHPAAVGWLSGYPFGWQRTAMQRRRLVCLGFTASGAPRHPLYVRADATFQTYKLT